MREHGGTRVQWHCWANMKRRFVFAAIAASLVTMACNPPAPADIPPDPSAAAQVGPAERLPRTLPAPSATTPRFVGEWAVSADGCTAPPWHWTAQGVSTEGGVSCAFTNIDITSTGYNIDASCSAAAPPAPYQIQLAFAESARAMMVSRGPWEGPISLIYCGR